MSDEEENGSPSQKLNAKHRKERKELQGRIVNMKHSLSKPDKKNKKQLNAQIEELEKELKTRHDAELAELGPGELTEELDEPPADTEESGENKSETTEYRITKAQRRRDKKAAENRRRLELEEEDRRNAETSLGRIEMKSIKDILAKQSLALHETPPNGDCLYESIAHQYSLTISEDVTANEMRQKAANYIREKKDEFLPYLRREDGKDGVMDDIDFEAYCEKVERSCQDGGVWGGEPELRALSCALERRIEVMKAEGSIVVYGDQWEPLYIVYHRHAFNLGEHYNSTVPC